MKFCRRCGASLTQQSDNTYRCSAGHTIFLNASPTVGIFFLTTDGKVLLSVRGIEPHKGLLDSFGGFVDKDETGEAAAVRELTEELGLQPTDYEPLTYFTSSVAQYEYEHEMHPVINMFFWSRLKPGVKLQPQDDVAGVEEHPLHNLDMSKLHDNGIRAGVRALQVLFTTEVSK